MFKKITIQGHPDYPDFVIDFSTDSNKLDNDEGLEEVYDSSRTSNTFEIESIEGVDLLHRIFLLSEGSESKNLKKRIVLNELLLLLSYLHKKNYGSSLSSITKGSNNISTLIIEIEYYHNNSLYKYYTILDNGVFLYQSISEKVKINGEVLYVEKYSTEENITIYSKLEDISYPSVYNYFYEQVIHLSGISLPSVLDKTLNNTDLLSYYCKTLSRLISTSYTSKIFDEILSIMSITDSLSSSKSVVITSVQTNDKDVNFPIYVLNSKNKKNEISNYIETADINSEMLMISIILFVCTISLDGVFVIHNIDQIIDFKKEYYYIERLKKAIDYCNDLKETNLSSTKGMQVIMSLSSDENLKYLV